MERLEDIVLWARNELSQMLDRRIDEIDSTKTFAQLGVNSGLATHLLIAFEDKLQVELDPDVVAGLPTIDALASYALALTQPAEARP